jgi:hypothetical protein
MTTQGKLSGNPLKETTFRGPTTGNPSSGPPRGDPLSGNPTRDIIQETPLTGTPKSDTSVDPFLETHSATHACDPLQGPVCWGHDPGDPPHGTPLVTTDMEPLQWTPCRESHQWGSLQGTSYVDVIQGIHFMGPLSGDPLQRTHFSRRFHGTPFRESPLLDPS